MRRCSALLMCILLLLAVLAALAYATQIAYRSPQDLGEQSALVIRGKVQSVESYWNPKHTKIFTRTRIAVDETYKGNSRPMIDLVQMGGVVGNVKVTVQGAVQWTAGEEVLLFAEPYDESSFQVSGFSQGKFKIERDRATGIAYVDAPAAEGVSLLGAPAPQKPSRAPLEQRATLEQFVGQALGRSGGPGVDR
jgi:hypothetical protein